MFAINLTAVLPLRSAPDEGAEQLTQILFGELIYVTEQIDRWTRIRNVADSYEGWVDSKMITILGEDEFTKLSGSPLYYISETLSRADSDRGPVMLPLGAFLPGYDPEKEEFQAGGHCFSISRSQTDRVTTEKNVASMMAEAEKLLNAPYLWGGKSILGLDCSGLTQIAFRLSGIDLPRDARQQILHGEVITSLEQALTGDLLFFATADEKVKHVGIYVAPGKILHASGYVHLDDLDKTGHILSQITTYDHYHLAGIRRFEF
ncbi:MAG: NlpC/P60 family protein [Bacteroidales bacterium]